MFNARNGVARRPVSLVCLQLRYAEQVEYGLAVDLAKDGVLLVEPGTLVHRHEELRLVHVRLARVCHSYDAAATELEARMELIQKGLAPVDAFAARARASRVSTLDHEVLDDPVEDGLVVVALEAELDEVATRSGGFLAPEVDLDLAVVGGEDDFGIRGRLLSINC
jgi:hypothetical protein